MLEQESYQGSSALKNKNLYTEIIKPHCGVGGVEREKAKKRGNKEESINLSVGSFSMNKKNASDTHKSY